MSTLKRKRREIKRSENETKVKCCDTDSVTMKSNFWQDWKSKREDASTENSKWKLRSTLTAFLWMMSNLVKLGLWHCRDWKANTCGVQKVSSLIQRFEKLCSAQWLLSRLNLFSKQTSISFGLGKKTIEILKVLWTKKVWQLLKYENYNAKQLENLDEIDEFVEKW